MDKKELMVANYNNTNNTVGKKEENSCNSLVIILSIKQISTYKVCSTVSAIKWAFSTPYVCIILLFLEHYCIVL